MGVFSAKCAHCGSREHATSDCPHPFFASACAHCGSNDHATEDCPHAFFESKCSHCGSKEHATSDCPHPFFASACAHCGSHDHATEDCPHAFFASKCGHCGSREHATPECPQGLFSSSRPQSGAKDASFKDSESSSDVAGEGMGWLGIALGAFALFLGLAVVLAAAMISLVTVSASLVCTLIYWQYRSSSLDREKLKHVPVSTVKKRNKTQYVVKDDAVDTHLIPRLHPELLTIPAVLLAGWIAISTIFDQSDILMKIVMILGSGLAVYAAWYCVRWLLRFLGKQEILKLQGFR